MADKQRVALVTGASSGLGQTTAARLAERGFRVFGTSRQPAAGNPGVEMIELDVTSVESVNACVGFVLTQCGSIDLLVNNAGRTHASLIEETAL
jgi:NAD(P)-dependent dehydrogenase (short-subunit alcohol dehydrogenase family)